MMRAFIAKQLVRWASHSIGVSYDVWKYEDMTGRKLPLRKSIVDRYSLFVNWLALPMANRIDETAATDEMIRHGWWG